jgi:hypothetical protein
VWHLFSKPKKLVTLLLSDTILSMSMFEFGVSAYQKVCKTVILARSEFHQGIIFNSSALKKYIAPFLTHHAEGSCYVAIGIEGSAVHERIVPIERDALASFDGAQHIPSSLVWNAIVMPTHAHEHAHVYLFGMRREHLMQYQLLALQTSFSCCLVSSINGAITALNSATQEWPTALPSLNTYRSHALEQYLTHQSGIHLLNHEKKEINAGHVGLFLLGKHSYENSQ